mgnify:CR=1 FL=1
MDFQRTLIIAGLCVVSYLMVLQWNEDYGQTVRTEPTVQFSSPESSDLPIPSISSPNTVVSDTTDLPSVENEPTLDIAKDLASSSRYIQVETDIVKAVIDLHGGDLIGLSFKQYPVSLNQPDVPFPFLEKNNIRSYVAQSGLIGALGPDNNKSRAIYTSAKSEFILEDSAETLNVVLSWQSDKGIEVEKVFSFKRGNYLIDQTFNVKNDGADFWKGTLFGQIKRDASEDPSSGTAMGVQSYLGAALFTEDEPYRKVDFDDMDTGKDSFNVTGGWISMVQHYFISAWIPNSESQNSYTTRRSGDNYIIGFTSPLVTLAPGEQTSISANFYAGPKNQELLGDLSKGLDLTIDYSFLWWIAQPLFMGLNWFYSLVGNWGVAIILLTVSVKAVFFHLSATSYKSMANMRRVQPELTRLKDLYGDDRQKMSQEMMGLYKREKINPLGGCLPILVQMPVFIALYWVLLESVELRQAPFALWIQDLSVKDPFFILPIIMTASMFVQQMLNPTPPDPVQAKVMKMMPVMFGVFFLFFPSGLVLYWVVNNLLSILQQWVITRRIEAGAKA